jgi:thioredoxin reductase (NADPH)
MITADLLLGIKLFAPVPESERNSIASHAADISVRPGEFVIQEGETAAFFALLSGRMTVRKRMGGGEQVLTTYEPGDFFGEVPLLLGSPSLASVRAEEHSRVMRLDATDFNHLITGCEKLRGEVMRTMAVRVAKVQQIEAETPVQVVTVIGNRLDASCHDVRDFLTRAQLPVRWLDPEEPTERSRIPEGVDCSAGSPIVVLADGRRLIAPSTRVLAEGLGLPTVPVRETYGVVIVGAGPAGLAAAVYGASEGLETLAIERLAPGGQAGTSSRIENYLGFPAGLSGDTLSSLATQQAKRLGAELLTARCCTGIEPGRDGGAHTLTLDGGQQLSATTVIVATGVSWRPLDVPGFEALVSRGIYYGAARTEALSVRGQDIYLVGGGNSAGQAAILFSGYANSVTLLVRNPSLRESMSSYLVEQLETKSNIRVEGESDVVEVQGRDSLEAIVVQNHRTGMRDTRPTRALFVFIGSRADTKWLPAEVLRDEQGYVCTGRDVLDLQKSAGGVWPLPRDPFLLETSVPGIFAAGDVRHGSIKRVASSVGEGSMAIAFVHQFLAERASGVRSASEAARSRSAPAPAGRARGEGDQAVRV